MPNGFFMSENGFWIPVINSFVKINIAVAGGSRYSGESIYDKNRRAII